MIGKFRKKEPTIFDEQITAILDEMHEFGPNSEEYEKLLEYLQKITSIKADASPSKRVSPDTVLMVLGNLFGILIIVAYEQKHVLTSKGVGFILKPKNNAAQ